ncbi:type III PLP-dependent enzyme [Actinomadura logoneensis]|uniref:Type III PLP-dependent enzyme n=1 Tax=Actinomadura logoneensis TaxID=2293572 RepID=A0A372JR93_9ACTN|nr:type III PLP-dependent enzyme [Actinomadura logoneensis]RFU42517.1 type III PLP-dependent enzyme [Actinomadura logoneensis]
MLTDRLREWTATSPRLPAFVYDLDVLDAHARRIRDAVPIEILYAAKANPDAPILRTLAPHVDGFEVASGGELRHVRSVLPEARLAFGGPGKTDAELDLPADRIHVESPYELARLAAKGRPADVLLRANLAGDRTGVALAMSGPFGMDPDVIEECREILASAPWLRLRGVHAHLASGLDAPELVVQSREILDWARPWAEKAEIEDPEFNLGGGMAVDYAAPGATFDWEAYGRKIAALARPGETLRIEPGRAVTAYCGWYVTDVLDVKPAHGRWYAVLRGGTMHLRTPVTKQHDQPFTVLRNPAGGSGARRPSAHDAEITLVGQLCTPKDVFARDVSVAGIGVGDVVAFGMAGAYGWNISHRDFLMHDPPGFHYLAGDPRGYPPSEVP